MALLLMKAARAHTRPRDKNDTFMMLIPCPWCGDRHEQEFTHGGDASKIMPSGDRQSDSDAWYQYVYERVNPAGEHVEYWHHSFGCNKWFKVTRNTTSNEISASSKP